MCLANHYLEEFGVERCEVESSSTQLNSSWKGRERKVSEATPSKVRERAKARSRTKSPLTSAPEVIARRDTTCEGRKIEREGKRTNRERERRMTIRWLGFSSIGWAPANENQGGSWHRHCLYLGRPGEGVFISESRAVQRSMLRAKVSRKGNERKGKCRWSCWRQPRVATLTENLGILNSNNQVNCILERDERRRVEKKVQHRSIAESWGKGGKADIVGGSRIKRK